MAYLERNPAGNSAERIIAKPAKTKFYKKRWFKIVAPILLLLIIGGGLLSLKTGSVLNKITKGGLLNSIAHNIPGISDELKGEKDGRVNVLLLGMRGADLPGGGTLADTIILVSIKPQENQVSMISIPRDLYVTVPGTQDRQKINAVHAYGEQKSKGQGMEDMKTIIGEVTGLPIHYAISTNFAGFKQLVDAVGGVDITLDQPFDESVQFNEPHACDSFFNIPTGEYDNKYAKVYFPGTKTVKRKRLVKSYPLCTAPLDTLECGGAFKLPAGKQTLNGEQALCYARSRATSNDFERAKRQQLMLQLIKDKMLSVGTLTDFSKVNAILNSLGDNVRTDMQLWEMQRFYDIYKKMQNLQIHQRVLENSEEGLLYHPEEGTAGYILLPIGDNYDKIREMAANIFTLPEQSDIKPK
jgi:polyisoprenyl-teichoic acid--peptidoglycan teichoic acid transferase